MHVCKSVFERNPTKNSCLFSPVRIHLQTQFAISLGLKIMIMFFFLISELDTAVWQDHYERITARG